MQYFTLKIYVHCSLLLNLFSSARNNALSSENIIIPREFLNEYGFDDTITPAQIIGSSNVSKRDYIFRHSNSAPEIEIVAEPVIKIKSEKHGLVNREIFQAQSPEKKQDVNNLLSEVIKEISKIVINIISSFVNTVTTNNAIEIIN